MADDSAISGLLLRVLLSAASVASSVAIMAAHIQLVGVLPTRASRALCLERALARVCREAGACVARPVPSVDFQPPIALTPVACRLGSGNP